MSFPGSSDHPGSAGWRSRFIFSRHTVRLRLTLLYGCLFLVSSAGLLTLSYLVHFPGTYITGTGGSAPGRGGVDTSSVPTGTRSPQAQQHAADLLQFLIRSGVTLAIMTLVSIGLGWLVAGRILRPLRAMTATARQISEDNLHQRLAVQGPSDELKDLGDTFDGLLARLEGAFDAQRRFVANASHELRTPLTLERTMIEVALADPTASADSLRSTCVDLLVASEQQERLIEALLTLARSQRGLDHRDPFDLATVAAAVLQAREPEAQARGLRIDASLRSAPGAGDPLLIERLVTNLLENALQHNVGGGWIEIATGTQAEGSVLWVANTGPVIAPGEIDRLLQPFQRLTADRAGDGEGLGLGLSIVAAVAKAHGATITARPRPHGGLDIQVTFTASAPVPSGRPASRQHARSPAAQ
jgi:signal transduction histidine kinase